VTHVYHLNLEKENLISLFYSLLEVYILLISETIDLGGILFEWLDIVRTANVTTHGVWFFTRDDARNKHRS
jgi:hypothetical protein